jgi:hypothetical protein
MRKRIGLWTLNSLHYTLLTNVGTSQTHTAGWMQRQGFDLYLLDGTREFNSICTCLCLAVRTR